MPKPPDQSASNPGMLALPAPTMTVDNSGLARTSADQNEQIRERNLGGIRDITPIPSAPKPSELMGLNPAAGPLSATALGVGDDEEEALRDIAPDWQKNLTFLYAGRDEDGRLRYFDLSFLDPYGYWKRPITAMMRDQPWEQAAASGLSDMLTPFFGADIAAKAIFEVLANKKGTGGRIYNEDAGSLEQLQDITDHMWTALRPGVFSNIAGLVNASQGLRRESSGQPIEMRNELSALIGWRASTMDAKTGLLYRSRDFNDALSSAQWTLRKELTSVNPVSEADIRSAKDSAQRQYERAYTEMRRIVKAAEVVGVSRLGVEHAQEVARRFRVASGM